MSGQIENAPFYRDRFTDPQRRRAEALIMVHRLWPVLEPRLAVEIANWVIRGNPRSYIPSVTSRQATELERLIRGPEVKS